MPQYKRGSCGVKTSLYLLFSAFVFSTSISMLITLCARILPRPSESVCRLGDLRDRLSD